MPTFGASTFLGDITDYKKLKLRDNDGNFAVLSAPADVPADYELTLPAADGEIGQVLATDGAGSLAFITVADEFVKADAADPTAGYLDSKMDGATLTVDLATHKAAIADLGVSTAKLADLAVTESKLADLSVSTGKIQDVAIATAKLADLAVTEIKLADTSVSTSKLIDAAVTEAKLADNSVSTVKIQDSAVSEIKLTDNSISTVKIQDAAVTELKLADSSISTVKIQDAAISELKLADNSVSTAKVQDSAIATSKIADAAVTELKLAASAVTTPILNDSAVTTDKIAPLAITADKIADDAVTAVKLESVNLKQIAPLVPNADEVLLYDGIIWVSQKTRYEQAFTDAELVAGVLDVAHNLGKKFVICAVYSDADSQVIPDEVMLINSNLLKVDLTSFGPLVGTWNVAVIAY